MCGKEMIVMVAKGFGYKEITVKCGNTSPYGDPYLCDSCEKLHVGRNWRREAEESGEKW